MAVQNHDVVMVPRGYHPVGAPHGYYLYYLNVMAGPKRIGNFIMILNMNGSSRKVNNESVVNNLLKKGIRIGLKY